jgi:hypothetical protein
MRRRSAAAILALGVFLCAVPASSSAATVKKTVDATMVFEHGAYPTNPGRTQTKRLRRHVG